MNLGDIDIEERMEHYNVSGLSVTLINNREISMAKGYGNLESGTNRIITNNSIFNACSISKFLTTMLVLKLTEQGVLDLDVDVNKGLTSWKIPDNEYQNNKVSLRTLLSHQSGVIDPEGSFEEFDCAIGVPKMADLLGGRTSYCKETIKVMYEPGGDFQYSDAGFCIIQQLIEDVYGKPFEVVMNDLVFEPLNMKNSILDLTVLKARSEELSCGHNKHGSLIEGKYSIYPYAAASGLWTSASDLAILVRELMDSLKGASKIGLSENITKELISPQCKKWAGLGVFLDGSNREIEISSFGWGVGFQCMMVAYPYLETGTVIMTNTDLGVHQLKGIIGEVFKSLTS